MESRQIVKTEYIRQQVPPLPADPEYYPVVFVKKDGHYCLDETQAKNILKDRALDKGYQGELKGTLESMKGKE